ncbi:MAG: FHA domain-containing protein [Chloroflexota bacterium]
MTETAGGSLLVTSPDAPESVFELGAAAVVRVGRAPAPQNDLVLAHSGVSRNHLRIYCDRLPYRVQDMGSSNGTTMNDAPLPPNEVRPLSDGDVIAIGSFRLRYVAPPPKEDGARLEGLGVRAAVRRPPPAPPPPPPPDAPPPVERWVGMPARGSRWLQYLPPIYSDDEFLGRLLLIFEDLLGPVQQGVSHFDLFLDPATTPETFLPVLNEWLAGIAYERWAPEVQRTVLRQASWLYQARGTRAGLQRNLELCTACSVDILENVDGPHTFRVTIHAGGCAVDRRTVEHIIEMNRPAHTRYRLELD